MANVKDLEGIGEFKGAKLEGMGIHTVEDILERCASSAGRKEVSQGCGLTEHELLRFANMADLCRIKGVGQEYSELLEAAGVDTIKELRHRVPANLHAKMVQTNDAKKLVRALPSESQVAEWVEQAKTLEPKVTH